MSGYGDYLMLMATINNIKIQQPDSKIILTNITSKPYKTRNHFGQIIKNNPQIDQYLSTTRTNFLFVRFKNRKDDSIVYVSSNLRKVSSYAWKVNGRTEYPKNKHAIEVFCEPYDIINPALKPRLFLTDEEVKHAAQLMQQYKLKPGKFIIIEPATEHKNSSKLWPIPYWEKVCGEIKEKYPDVKIIQLSPYPVTLPGVINITKQSSFREALHFIEQSLTVITTEGGLMHLAAATEKQAIILYSGYLPKSLMSYPQHINLYADDSIPCLGCGDRLSCKNEVVRECMDSIKPEHVMEALTKITLPQ